MKKYAITHIISSTDNSTGGPARSVTHLIAAMLENSSHKIELFCEESQNPIINNFVKSTGSIYFCKLNKLGGLKGISVRLKISKPNLLHGHGLWQMPVHQMAKMARKNKIPYIITPRGMLEPWSLEQKKIKKKIALSLFQNKDLKNAACIHATATLEAENIRNLGYTNPIAVIPNGIDLKEFPEFKKSKAAEKRILFLSRIHQKKGIENLIEAWSQIHKIIRENWSITIVGNGEEKYIAALQALLINKGLSDQILIKGPMYGEDKLKEYQDADLFVLPTYSENFGIVIAEALACNTPVITTKGAPWNELETTQSGWWIDIGVEPLNKALEEALQTPPETLNQMGENGRKLVEEKYSIEAVTKQMLELYTWILEKEKKPEFVNLV
jgi:glycosyltransferase involved in cell wall biosynthesis